MACLYSKKKAVLQNEAPPCISLVDESKPIVVLTDGAWSLIVTMRLEQGSFWLTLSLGTKVVHEVHIPKELVQHWKSSKLGYPMLSSDTQLSSDPSVRTVCRMSS